jgi:elongation factor G
MGELHLDTKIDILRRTYEVDANIGALQVAFRERMTQRVEVEYTYQKIFGPKVEVEHTHKKIFGPKGEFAYVKFIVEPNEPGKGYEFESKIGGGAVAGFPVVDVKVQLVDAKYHDVDSSVRAFEIASRAAFREALQKGNPVLIEPVMKVEVVTPEDCIGSVIGDLNSRRGQILGQDMRGNANVINARVPLMQMFGYVNNLRTMSQGRATFQMQFDHYAPAPPSPENDPPFRPAIGMRA